jgi:hypothetical protein
MKGITKALAVLGLAFVGATGVAIQEGRAISADNENNAHLNETNLRLTQQLWAAHQVQLQCVDSLRDGRDYRWAVAHPSTEAHGGLEAVMTEDGGKRFDAASKMVLTAADQYGAVEKASQAYGSAIASGDKHAIQKTGAAFADTVQSMGVRMELSP